MRAWGPGLIALAIIAGVCACDSSSPAPPSVDVTGTWTGTCSVNGGVPFTTVFTFVQDGSELSGAVANLSIVGTVSDNVLTATAVNPPGDESIVLSFTATVVLDSMNIDGERTIDDGNTVVIEDVDCAVTRLNV